MSNVTQKDIDFAKGKYEAPRTMKELKDRIKRGTYGRKY